MHLNTTNHIEKDSRQDIYICGFDPGPYNAQRFKTLQLPYIVRWRNSCKVAYVGRVDHVTPKILRACIYIAPHDPLQGLKTQEGL